jgi:murein L,D-transpeptidase YcbB/YkuD
MATTRILVLALALVGLQASVAAGTETKDPQSTPAAGETSAVSTPSETLSPEAQPQEPSADQPAAAQPAVTEPAPQVVAPTTAVAAPETPVGLALKAKIEALPADGTDEEKKEREAIAAFYGARAYAPLWIEGNGFSAKAAVLMQEIENAAAWGLDPKDFVLLFTFKPGSAALQPAEDVAEADLGISLAALKYARYARGGRIMNPTEQLNSNLDRRPQLIAPSEVLQGLAGADDAGAYLAGTNPKHEQFVRLRDKYLAVTAKGKIPAGPDLTPGMKDPQVAALRQRLGVRVEAIGNNEGDAEHYDPGLEAAVIAFKESRKLTPANGTVDAATRAALNKSEKGDAKKIQANMEMWRWMNPDLGDMYMIANVPEFMIRLMKGGEMLHTERIVAGETGKQSSIFSRPLKNIVFRPMWRVPESIKVKELWPSLLRGGGLMRQYGLEVETKDGKPLDYRTMDWTKLDIRNYEVVQPPGRKSVLGVVKFSFPSQHTIFMHDTPDKWMFNSSQRTLSHGCLRLRNPVRMAELILAEDKGWDAAKIAELIRSGPLNNEVVMDKKIRMHITYFTQWVDDSGALKSYPDVYGHEKRVVQALAGKWNEIAKGRDHLAPIAPDMGLATKPQQTASTKASKSASEDFLGSFFGGFGN